MPSKSLTRTVIAPPPAPPVQNASDPQSAAPAPVVPDIITRLEPSLNTSANSGSLVIIDVIPDQRFPLMSWIYSVTHNVQSTVYLSSPSASPASLLGYTMLMYYGLLFHFDAYLRPTPSPSAYSILDSSAQHDLFSIMLDMLVPSFALAEFEAIRPHYDDLASNLGFFSSLASFEFGLDFGRIFPAAVFLQLHNLMASLPANTTYQTLAGHYFSTIVATITLPGNVNRDLTPSNYFGVTFQPNAGNPARYRNWFSQRIDALISASAIRVINATSAVTRLPLDSPARATFVNTNPYLYGIGYTYENGLFLRELLRDMNTFVSAAFPSSRPLRAYTQLGSPEIARHLTFDSVCPTWITLATPAAAAVTALFAPNAPVSSHATFATDIDFLVERPDFVAADPNAANGIGLAPGRDLANPPANSHRLDFVDAPPAAGPPDDPVLYRTFHESDNLTPDCLIFEPVANQTAHLAAVITSGKLIEIHDLSLIGLTIPTPFVPLGRNNSQFIQGAIPRDLVQAALTAPVTVHARTVDVIDRIAQLFHRGPPAHIYVPHFREGFVEQQFAPADPNVNTRYYRLYNNARLRIHSRRARDGLNVISSPLGTPPRIDNGSLVLWTSYRFYDAESQTWYLLPTLRHIYGVRARLFGSTHPALRIN